MQALVVTPGLAGSARIETVASPARRQDELLIETLDVGVCGTDRSIAAGKFGAAPSAQSDLILGHEVLGVVRAGTSGFSRGDLVSATVRRSCGRCQNCAAGDVDACTTGAFSERGIFGLHGFASELFLETAQNLIAIPPGLGRFGVLAEPMSIAQRGWRHARYVGNRQGWEPVRALVLGVGAIGFLSVLLARLAGLDTWAYARRPAHSARAELVRRCGANYASSAELSLDQLVKETGRPDVILEAAGDPELTAEAITCLAVNGVICLRGINPRTLDVAVRGDLLTDEIVLHNKAVIGSTNAAPLDWIDGVEDLARIAELWPGLIQEIVSCRVEPDDFDRAFDHDGVKAVVQFS